MTSRIALRALALSALSVLSAFSAFAQSGVLIGVSAPPPPLTDSASRPPTYQTMWIVRDRVRPIRATIPDLLVPRADGWWRVGTVAICPTGGPPGQEVDVLWRVRADSTPVVTEVCHELPRAELPLPIHAEDSAAADSARRELVRCSWSNIQVKFVSPEHIAIGETTGQTEECEPRGGRWYQSHYLSRFHGDSSLTLNQLTGPGVDSIGRLAITRAARELSKDERCVNIAGAFDPRELTGLGDAWYPSRDSGRWTPTLFHEVGTGACQLNASVDASLPHAFTGHDALRPPWTVLAKRVPGLRDAFASPSADLVIAQARDSLFVYLSDGRDLGQRIAAIPFGGREIVMIQWATGRHVARWNEEIIAMVTRGLPTPKIVAPSVDP
jgi:hypothetical protein